jgi:dehydrodolichyl diphosphate syntase complex subunit NUS1
MPVTARVAHDVHVKSSSLAERGRADLINPHLPRPNEEPVSRPKMSAPTRSNTKSPRRRHKPRIRPFIRSWIHYLIYFTIQTLYGIYIRFSHAYHALTQRTLAIMHHHYRSPEYIKKDISALSRLPEHLSIILKLRPSEENALETLLDEVAELSAWSTSAGIPLLSIYEKSGILKSYIPALESTVQSRLTSYFGKTSCPTVSITAPNHTSPSPNSSPNLNGHSNGTHPHPHSQPQSQPPTPHLSILLLSATDGRDTLVDLTRTLTEMAQSHKLSPRDITSDLINTEIMATTSVPAQPSSHTNPQSQSPPQSTSDSTPGEPDLLIIFANNTQLYGYPPWQIRLSEIYCVGDGGGDVNAAVRVEYQAFLRGLWKYAGAEMRFGR